jgi:hypothetical protein
MKEQWHQKRRLSRKNESRKQNSTIYELPKELVMTKPAKEIHNEYHTLQQQ